MNKVTVASIDARIDSVSYHHLPYSTITVCCIRMVNGFTVTGESACVDPAAFNKELGEEIAYDNAFDKLWALEGYLLVERLYQQSIQEEPHAESVDND
jgi:hypothetical protein